MTEHSSDVGKRVDRVTADDTPHEKYYDSGRPILLNTVNGQVVNKSVHAHTVCCASCDIPARFNKKSEPICPECGLICVGQEVVNEAQVVLGEETTGRVGPDDFRQ